jgi:hypothetical protein
MERRIDASGSVMSVAGRKRYSKIAGQFAARTIAMLRSPAYRALSLSGHRVIARVEIELADHGGQDNGVLPVTYADFMDYGLDRHAIGPAIRECQALGFIEVTEQGRSGNGEFRKASKYRLTYRHTERGPPSDEWKRFEEFDDAQVAANAARKSSLKRSRHKRDRQLTLPREEAA